MLLALLAACSPTPSGVWRLLVDVQPPGADECVPELSHSLESGFVPNDYDEDSPWSETSGEQWSETLLFALVTLGEDGRGTMVIGDMALPGTRAEDFTWTFTWESATTADDQISHGSGYAYTESLEQWRSVSVVGNFTDYGFEGTWTDIDHRLDRWSESDTWAEEVALEIGEVGAIPFDEWLRRRDGVDPVNRWDAVDCTTATCVLSLATDCEQTWRVHGTRTDLEAGDYAAVSGAGQSAGY